MCESYESIREGVLLCIGKPVQCEWCGQMLQLGETAVLRVYKFAGDFNSTRMHPECYKAMDDYDYQCDGWEFGEFMRGSTRYNWEHYGPE